MSGSAAIFSSRKRICFLTVSSSASTVALSSLEAQLSEAEELVTTKAAERAAAEAAHAEAEQLVERLKRQLLEEVGNPSQLDQALASQG